MGRLRNKSHKDDPILIHLAMGRNMLDARKHGEAKLAQLLEMAAEAVVAERGTVSTKIAHLNAENEARLADLRVKHQSEVQALAESHDKQVQAVQDLTQKLSLLRPRPLPDGAKTKVEPPCLGILPSGDRILEEWTIDSALEALINLQVAGANGNTPVELDHRYIECDTRYPLPLTREEIRVQNERQAFKKRAVVARRIKRAGIVAAALLATPPAVVTLFAGASFLWSAAWGLM